MTRHALAVVAAVIAILAVFALWPPSTKSDQPVAATTVPAGEFVNVTPGATVSKRYWLEASRQPARSSRTPSPTLPNVRRASVSPSAPRLVSVAPVVAATGPSGKRDTSMTGTASWFASPIGVSAAGPALRTAIGVGWRGTRVTVCGPAGCAVTILGDWMRADRLIDLDVSVFPAVCGPLSLGLCRVEVIP